ncbi:P-loop NTPase fold protein, partial [uncultured Kiloniella sp.]|uniref:P-loop NTPase fold protein n=1 Tax=uncultured Kiloniella sp. TaxID=1133091 RepID=UPI00262B575D
MEHNEAARRVLENYAESPEPQYALLIEAAWGAGKTHFVETELAKQLASDKARYASLNGVDSPQAFRRKILSKSYLSVDTKAAENFGNLVGKLTKTGNVGSLIRDYAEAQMLADLPDILIFDD